MTVADILETIRTENATALSRLGSSKALYAETAGQLDAETVCNAAAAAEYAAYKTLSEWAADESDDDAIAVFESIAEIEYEHFETVKTHSDSVDVEDAAVPKLQTVLRSYTDTIDRAGGLLGRCLVAKKSKEQYTGYFVGDADPQTAQLFRELGSDVTKQQEQTLSLIDSVCETPADYDRAVEAATAVIQAAYEEYTDSLESLGVNPKPVC